MAIAFSYVWLPFMILPVYAALERVPGSLIEASRDLGAKGSTTFRTVLLPLAFPGVVAGSIFTFSLTLGDFITPTIVGGDNHQLIGSVVYSNFGIANNAPFAAAFATVPLVIMAIYLHRRQASRRLRAPLAVETRTTGALLRVWTILVVIFLWIPLAVIMLYAFNRSNVQTWPIKHYSTHWFGVAWNDQEVRDAFVLSLKVALCGDRGGARARQRGGLRRRALPLLRRQLGLVPGDHPDRPAGRDHRNRTAVVVRASRASRSRSGRS